MKKLIALLSVSLFTTVLTTTAQTKNDQNTEQANELKAWENYKQPGPVHEMLSKCNGNWKTEMTMWMDPSSEPAKSTGTCENSMIMGNRYQQTLFHGTFQNMPFEGMGVTSYDNAKKVFTNSWIDNMGTGMMVMEGTWDDAAKTINYTGKTVDPMSGKDIPVRETFKILDDNTQLMTMYMTYNGQEFKTMEVRFTRM